MEPGERLRKHCVYPVVKLTGYEDGLERLTRLRVDVDGSRLRTESLGNRLSDDPSRGPEPEAIVAWLSQIGKEPNLRSEETYLLGGLVRPTSVELWRPVSRKHDQGNARFTRFDDRRKVVCGRASGSTDEERGAKRAARLAERIVCSGTLIDRARALETFVLEGGDYERRGTRPWTDERVTDSGLDEAVDDEPRPLRL
jgi:hypothetical protein